jgi:hypothetical protein
MMAQESKTAATSAPVATATLLMQLIGNAYLVTGHAVMQGMKF